MSPHTQDAPVEQRMPDAQPSSLPSISPQTGVVFVVDDEEMVTQSIAAMLTLETDWDVYTFNQPAKALAALTQVKPDVVVSDFLMPDMNGIQFLKAIKQALPDVTTILLTGYADKQNAIEAINEVGLYRYLEKPWDNDQLRLSIENAMERTHLIENLKQTITELQTAQGQLAQQNEHLEQLVEERTQDLKRAYGQLESVFRHTEDGIVTLSPALRITSANPAVQTWLKHSFEPFEEDHAASAAGIPFQGSPADRLKTLYGAPISHLISAPSEARLLGILSQRVVPSHIDDARIGQTPVEISLSEIPNDGGWVLVLRDITRRKELDRMREDFVSTLTHDLRTPLLAAIQTLSFFVNGSVGEVPPNQKNLLEMLIQSNQELLGMVNALLEVYKYEAGRQKLILDRLPLIPLITMITQELAALAQHKNQTLIFNPPSDAAEQYVVIGDKQELRRVFVNLIGNALHYTPAEGTIEVKMAPVTVPLGESQTVRQAIQIDILDNGRGIPEADIKKLFQRFSQGTSQKRSSGTGLGLYLSRQIIEAHHGKIGVESQLNTGSRFFVILPVSDSVKT